jgi:adenylylsulfate kinase
MIQADTPGFVVWVTGLPASGKSTLAAAVVHHLGDLGVRPAVLESDELRRVLTPKPNYSENERDAFYAAVVYIASLLSRHGVPVIIDATGNRRAYRQQAREQMRRFLEVFVDCPLGVCVARDPKGIYAHAGMSPGGNVPGMQAAYEPPTNPDVVLRGEDAETLGDSARRVVHALAERGWLDAPAVEPRRPLSNTQRGEVHASDGPAA